MFELKPLSKETIARALEKAERYRLLNEPADAESICLDVLRVDPENQQALVMLLLALTDQFAEGLAGAFSEARSVLPRLRDEYARTYYAGIIHERRAKSQLRLGGPGSGYVAYDAFHEAMGWFEKAERLRPPGNDDALLRWNACARILQRNPHVTESPQERFEQPLE
jgi:tetratricopeptide (TPR) repeat protein